MRRIASWTAGVRPDPPLACFFNLWAYTTRPGVDDAFFMRPPPPRRRHHTHCTGVSACASGTCSGTRWRPRLPLMGAAARRVGGKGRGTGTTKREAGRREAIMPAVAGAGLVDERGEEGCWEGRWALMVVIWAPAGVVGRCRNWRAPQAQHSNNSEPHQRATHNRRGGTRRLPQ